MFGNRELPENQSRVLVEMSDGSVEVIDLFLTFLYTGEFKDKEGTSENFQAWNEEMLNGLVHISDKVSVITITIHQGLSQHVSFFTF